jgi:hypothetical protein
MNYGVSSIPTGRQKSVRGALRMNEIKITVAQATATQAVLTQFILRKPIYRRLLMNNCPISRDGRVVDCHGVDGSGGLGFDSGEGA